MYVRSFGTILLQEQFPVVYYHLQVGAPQVAVLPEVVHVDFSISSVFFLSGSFFLIFAGIFLFIIELTDSDMDRM